MAEIRVLELEKRVTELDFINKEKVEVWYSSKEHMTSLAHFTIYFSILKYCLEFLVFLCQQF
jgi:hypothetical protein